MSRADLITSAFSLAYQESNPEAQATGGPPRRPVPELSQAPPPVFAVEPSTPAFLFNPELGEHAFTSLSLLR